MAKKRAKRVPPARRIDVTRLEYEALLAIAQRNNAAIKDLQSAASIQFRRCAEIQQEIDQLKRSAK